MKLQDLKPVFYIFQNGGSMSHSLIEFFTYNMEKDNWKLVNSFSGKESFLNFSKPDKTCTIRIIEKWTGTTTVEIRVGPLGEKKM